jgi:hypothetical protein
VAGATRIARRARPNGAQARSRAAAERAFRSAEELEEVLDQLLATVDADDRVGPLLRAARLQVRFDFTDLRVGLNLESTTEDLDANLRWSFARKPPWPPRLLLEMSSAVANSYLQGRENLPVAIARKRVRCRCDARSALLFLPAARLLVTPYRELISARYPHLLLDPATAAVPAARGPWAGKWD